MASELNSLLIRPSPFTYNPVLFDFHLRALAKMRAPTSEFVRVLPSPPQLTFLIRLDWYLTHRDSTRDTYEFRQVLKQRANFPRLVWKMQKLRLTTRLQRVGDATPHIGEV